MTDHEPDMKNGTCPKCKTANVRVQQGAFGQRNFLPVGWFGRAKVCNYVCVACGYLESYVATHDIGKIARGWGRVPQSEPV